MTDEAAGVRAHYGPFTRFCVGIAGADLELLQFCPERELQNVKFLAYLELGVAIYQAAIFSAVGHYLFAHPGVIHPEIIVASIFLAGLIMLIDSYVIMRSSWHLHGISELKRGGLDIAGGTSAQIRNALFLVLRGGFAVNIALLVAGFLLTMIFSTDIGSKSQEQYRAQNAALFSEQKARVGSQINKAGEVVAASDAAISALNAEDAKLRLAGLAPISDPPGLNETSAMVRRLETDMGNAERDLAATRSFASDELAGIKRAPGNTGVAGDGPIRAAAQERIKAAEALVTSISAQLDRARTDLKVMQSAIDARLSGDRRQIDERRAAILAARDAEQARRAGFQEKYESLVQGRDGAILQGVENDPSHVPPKTGLLAQLSYLRQLAADPEIMVVIILVELASLGIELAAVFAKVFSFVPTVYATSLAQESYMSAYHTARGMARAMASDPFNNPPTTPNDPDSANDNMETEEAHERDWPTVNGIDLSPENDNPPPRRRGRPRRKQ